MNLHNDKEIFNQAILSTAEHFGINEVFVEKDYWVTYVLKSLSQSKYKDVVVFKGGTSLSKAYKLINRFSEDIDLAILQKGEVSGNTIKNLIRDIEKEITKELVPIEVVGVTSKGSKFRKTIFEYPKIIEGGFFGQASDKLLVEINSFATPHPYAEMPIQTLIADFLLETNRQDIALAQGLDPFTVNVLGLERTLTEKVLSMVRASYEENEMDILASKVRHLYDIHFILTLPTMQNFVLGKDFHEMIKEVLADDERNSQFQGEWTKIPLSKSKFFSDWDGIWNKLRIVYQNEFSSLIFGQLPDSADIDDTIKLIKKSV